MTSCGQSYERADCLNIIDGFVWVEGWTGRLDITDEFMWVQLQARRLDITDNSKL
jgi:hypothetical protein